MKAEYFNGNGFRRYAGFFLILFLCLTVMVPQVSAAELQITSNVSGHPMPRPIINGDKIVWSEYRNGYWNHYVYDLTTNQETQVYQNDRSVPKFFGTDGNKIVWEDKNPWWGNDIYVYDIATAQWDQISNSHYAHQPSISGNKIVWSDSRRGVDFLDIYMYDLATQQETLVTTGRNNLAKIDGDKIAYVKTTVINGSLVENIYLYDLSTNQNIPITHHTQEYSGTGAQWTGPYSVMSPSISGNKIVWSDYRTGTWDVYMYNLTTGQTTQIVASRAICQWNSSRQWQLEVGISRNA